MAIKLTNMLGYSLKVYQYRIQVEVTSEAVSNTRPFPTPPTEGIGDIGTKIDPVGSLILKYHVVSGIIF
jgi:hypothetical protein